MENPIQNGTIETLTVEWHKKLSLGDGHVLEATAKGSVTLEMLVPDRNSQKCNLRKLLYFPKVTHNLLSVSKASEAGKS